MDQELTDLLEKCQKSGSFNADLSRKYWGWQENFQCENLEGSIEERVDDDTEEVMEILTSMMEEKDAWETPDENFEMPTGKKFKGV